MPTMRESAVYRGQFVVPVYSVLDYVFCAFFSEIPEKKCFTFFNHMPKVVSCKQKVLFFNRTSEQLDICKIVFFYQPSRL